MVANAAEDAEADAEGTAPRKQQHSSAVVSDPDQVIAGELADDESNKRTGPKSKRKHQLGVRRAAGGGAHADEARAGGAGDQGASTGNQDMLLSPAADCDGAATRIQSVYRGHQGRNLYFFLLGNEIFASEAQRLDHASAALVIQCAFRCFQARNQYYDLLGTGDGCTRAPSYEGSVVPDAIFEKYLRVLEGNVFSVEQALREATGKAKADGRAPGRAGDDRRLAALLEENSQLHAKLAEANDFLKSMSLGASSSLETQTLKIQLEMKDEEIEEMQEELKDKLEELASVKEELQRFQSSRTQAEEFGQGLNAPLGAAQETCEGLEETLGILIGAVSAALNSRDQTHMEVGNLQALANSLQERNDTLMYENQHLRTKAAGLGKDQEDKLAASEAEVQELTATLASLKASKDALVEQLHDTNGELTARCREVDRLNEELNESQHNLLAAQKCADELRARSDACNDELLSLNERMKQMQEAGQTFESGKAAAALATKTLTGQLDAERQRLALLEEESNHLQVAFAKAQESFAAKEKELDALRCEREGQDAVEERLIGGLLRYMETHMVGIAALETQLRLRENAQHMIAEEHAQGLAQALDTTAAAAASLAAIEKQQQQQQAQLASAKQQVTQALEAAAAHTSLTTNLSAQVDALTADICNLRSALAEAKTAHEKETAQLMATLAEEKSAREELRAEFTIISSSVDGAQQLQVALERVQLEKGKADAENSDLYQRMKALEAEIAAAENNEENKRLKCLIDTMQAEKDAMLEEMMAVNSQATNIITGLEEAELLQCRTLKSLKYSLKNLIGVHDTQVLKCRQLQEVMHSTQKLEQEQVASSNSLATLQSENLEREQEVQRLQEQVACLEQELEYIKQQDFEARKVHQVLEVQLQGAQQSIFTLTAKLKEARDQADAAECELEQQKAEEKVGQISSMLDVMMLNVKKIEDELQDIGDATWRIDAQQQGQIEMLTADLHLNHQALRALTLEKDKLGPEVEALRSINSEQLSEIIALKASQKDLLQSLSETLSTAAIEAARYELVHNASLAQKIEHMQLQQGERAGAFADEEKETTKEVKAHVHNKKDSIQTRLLWQGQEHSIHDEFCMVLDELFECGLGLDMAVTRMVHELAALDQRFKALQYVNERMCQIQRQREQEMERERKREEERESERARERQQETEREDRREMNMASVREQDMAHQDAFLSEDSGRRINAEQARTNTHPTGQNQHELQHLRLVLEQKDRLLLSQGTTVSALETAIEALKGQVLSVKSEMNTALHEKDAVISQLQRELAGWPSKHLNASRSSLALPSMFLSAVFDGKSAGLEEDVHSHHTGYDVDPRRATTPTTASQISVNFGQEQVPMKSGSGQRGQEAKTFKDKEFEERSWFGLHHRLESRELYESTWPGDEGRDWQTQRNTRRDPLLQHYVHSNVSELDRAGMNPLSTPPQRVYHQHFLDGGADRGTVSLSRRLRSLAQSGAELSAGHDKWEDESGAHTKALGSEKMTVSKYLVDSPRGIRS